MFCRTFQDCNFPCYSVKSQWSPSKVISVKDDGQERGVRSVPLLSPVAIQITTNNVGWVDDKYSQNCRTILCSLIRIVTNYFSFCFYKLSTGWIITRQLQHSTVRTFLGKWSEDKNRWNCIQQFEETSHFDSGQSGSNCCYSCPPWSSRQMSIVAGGV